MIGAPSPSGLWWREQCDLLEADYRARLGKCWQSIAARATDEENPITMRELLEACEIHQVLPAAIIEAVEIAHRSRQALQTGGES